MIFKIPSKRNNLSNQNTAPALFEHKFVVIQAKLGDSTRLECNATGDQPMTIDWFREGTNETIEKHGNDLYDIHESVNDFGVSSYMQIRSVNRDDNLLYKCLARNEFGSSERMLKLIVLGVPDKPQQLKIRDIWSRSALVTWLSSSVQTANHSGGRISNYTVQYWRKNPSSLSSSAIATSSLGGLPPLFPQQQQQNHRREEIVVDGLQSSALLVNLLPALTYEVSVIANNQVGQSEPSETINVTTSEEEPSAPPTDVQVEARGSSSLRVQWKVPPNESLNGKLLGFYIGYRPRFSLGNAISQGLSISMQQPQQNLVNNPSPHQQQQQQQQANHQSVIYSFKTADAIDGQLFYDTFLSGLKHNQDYEIIVRAFNKAGSGPDCHIVLARTNSAKLPQAPNLQILKYTSNAITLKWTSTVMMIGNGGSSNSGQLQLTNRLSSPTNHIQPNLIGLDILRYILYYQLQGEREWYELTVPTNQVTDHGTDSALSPSGTTSNELITSHSSLHTLSNLQPGLTYRIYVAAANDYGVGDPSNVITVKLDSLNSTSQSAFLGAALLDSSGLLMSGGSIGGASGLFDSWNQQHGHIFTVLSFIIVLIVLVAISVYLVWQYKLRNKYNSSSASSYPTSWTPAATDTIQSEYSIKRFPISTSIVGGVSSSGTLGLQQSLASHEAYDETGNGRHRIHSHHSFGAGTVGAGRSVVAQKQQMIRNNNSNTTTRPILSSHYHQPAELRSSATLNRNQNRQLPPIPYSTLSVKEMQGNKQHQHQSWQPHCQQQRQLPPPLPPTSEYRICKQQQSNNKHHNQHSTGGSQTPLIYGVIE